MRFPSVPAFADLAYDEAAALQQGTSAASVLTMLEAQADYFERMAEEARQAIAAFVAARPALAPFAAPRPPPFVPVARSTFAAELIAANPGPQAREDPPPVFYDEAGQCSICHEDFEDSERVCLTAERREAV